MERNNLPKIPEGWQLELWWPLGKTQYPQELAIVTFSKKDLISELERRQSIEMRFDYRLLAGPGGFEVYEIKREQL